MSQNVEDFIKHHGVRGMKWGVRRARGSVTPASSDYKKTAPLRTKKPHELTNKQLEAVNKRANLEKNFKQLHPTPASKAKKVLKTLTTGKAVAGEILGVGAMATAAYKYYDSPAGKAVKAVVKKQLAKHGSKTMTGWY